ncbi:hypothetical protein NDU88_002371 [Pleurodeles waltl]|uniref:Uncharacterized protein n=1 Tax=Pleurodeles waltl TaxID=8319 RepID=A0AAV7UB05_PLEWA|nr:hypothetical protein NDU88_002371 [Pleurodeles waltl]
MAKGAGRPPYQLRGKRYTQCPGFGRFGRFGQNGQRPRGAQGGGPILERGVGGPDGDGCSLKQTGSLRTTAENMRGEPGSGGRSRRARDPAERGEPVETASRHRRNRKLGSPFSKEMHKERQKAMEAVASLSRSDLGSHPRKDEELEHSGSDLDSEGSQASNESGPEVTPGTSDCII